MRSLNIPEGYKIKHLLNNGICQTYSCENSEGNLYVLKILPKKTEDEEFNQSLQREIEFLQYFNNKYVIRTENIIEKPDNYIIIFPYIKGKEFKGCFNFETEKEYAILMLKAAIGLYCIHSHNIVHGDLQPANILVNEETNDPIIIDFGFAHPNDIKSPQFTPAYAAPELLNNDDDNNDISTTFETDVYALGLIFYIFITNLQSAEMIKKNKIFTEDNWNTHPESLKELVSSMLNSSPKDRITIQNCLNHKYFEEIIGKEEIENLLKDANLIHM